MPQLPFAPADVQVAHDDVLAVVSETDWSTFGLGFMSSYPRGWCSAMSYTIGRLLLHRGLGTWRIAGNGSHDWLEYVDGGDIVYSVDATQHQFPNHEAAWFGWGLAPSAKSHPAYHYATCGQEPDSWAKGVELAVSAEVMRLLG